MIHRTLRIEGRGYRIKHLVTHPESAVLWFQLGTNRVLRWVVPSSISVFCFDKKQIHLLGPVAAVGARRRSLQSLRMPDVYAGKGLVYVGRPLRRKAGKKAWSALTIWFLGTRGNRVAVAQR